MLILRDENGSTARSVLALGMFDGVHLGHRVLLRRAAALKRRAHAPLVCCTFTTHPLALLRPESCPPMLTTLSERAALMAACGVDALCALPFDERMRDTLPEAFIAALCRRFRPAYVVAGYNYAFGQGGEGGAELLAALGRVFRYRAEIVPQITLDGAPISSTAIRALLAQGDAGGARRLLGHPYEQHARVLDDDGARATLALARDGKQALPPGAYRALIGGDGRFVPATLVLREGGLAACASLQPLARDGAVRVRYLSHV